MQKNVAFIGTGEIARLHAASIARENPAWRVVGGFDTNEKAAQDFCGIYTGSCYKSAQQLLRDETVEVVYICTRHDSHVKYALDACAAQKSIFLEKPVALHGADALRLQQAVTANRVTLAVGYNMRVTPATKRLCALLRQHKAAPVSFRASMTGPPFMDGWASDAVQGGGVLVCQGSHMLDLLAYVLRSPVADICVATQHIGLAQEREPNAATLLVKMENNVCGTLLLHDRGCPTYHAQEEGKMVQLTVYAPQGTFEADIYGKVRWGTQDGYHEEQPDDRSQCVCWGYAAQAKEFARLLDTGESCLCTLEEGVRTAIAVDAARQAARNMRWTSASQ